MAEHREKLRLSIKFNNEVKFYDFENNYNNYRELRKWCQKLHLLSNKIINDIELTKNSDQTGRCQLLVNHIQQILDTTFSQEIKTVVGTILVNVKLSDELQLTEYTEEVQPASNIKICNIKTRNTITPTSSTLPVYKMQTKNRGVLFFVTIRHFPKHQYKIRSGSEHDKFYLITLFRKFGYTIYYYEDLLLDTFWRLVDRLIDFHLNDTESMMFVVASHGHENENIEFFYGEETKTSDIIFKFNNLNCNRMNSKPKVFLLPCCRGDKRDYGVSEWESLESDGLTNAQPIFSDILICYATIDSYVTYRDPNFGSWYILAFYRILAENALKMDLEGMLYLVTQELLAINEKYIETKLEDDPHFKSFFQTPSCVRMDFNKLLYFNPGYIEHS